VGKSIEMEARQPDSRHSAGKQRKLKLTSPCGSCCVEPGAALAAIHTRGTADGHSRDERKDRGLLLPVQRPHRHDQEAEGYVPCPR
jgi:hypothetical protein